jgi:serine/threonine protein kinase
MVGPERESQFATARLPMGAHFPRPRPATMPDFSEPSVGQRIGSYRLLAKIGQGGMGTVYKAIHTRLGKVVALKLLPVDIGHGEEAAARFEREMHTAARVNHRHIVHATDAGECDGIPYLAMEYLDGIDGARLVKAVSTLPVAAACELTRQAALGLQHVHEQGLVHRDVKPSNLMLGRDGVVRLLDLGLARIHGRKDELTRTGQMLGTMDYLAPEQAGDAGAVDIRADLYSLGCTLYHLLAGRPPFSGPGFDHAAKKLTAHLTIVPAELGQLRPDVPADLDACLARLLAKDPADRLATPQKLVQALQPFCEAADLAELIAQVGLRPACPPSPAAKSTQMPRHTRML